ncbi:MAG: hypothetical protein ACREUE_20010 [Panacagrimonas sp.]
MKRFFWMALLAPMVSMAGELPAPLQAALEKGGEFHLFSIRPARVEKTEGALHFHGWEVIGRTSIRDEEKRKKLVGAFKTGIEENQGIGAACFRPRHGIRITEQGKVTDFIICFECFQVQVMVDGLPQKAVLVTRTPEPAFNEALKQAKLPLSDL